MKWLGCSPIPYESSVLSSASILPWSHIGKMLEGSMTQSQLTRENKLLPLYLGAIALVDLILELPY